MRVTATRSRAATSPAAVSGSASDLLAGTQLPYADARSVGTPAVATADRNRSAEGEDQRLRARRQELDLERAVRDRPRLPDELVEPLLRQRAVPVCVDVVAVGL